MKNTVIIPSLLQFFTESSCLIYLINVATFQNFEKVCNIVFCNILKFPKKFATFRFATYQKFSKNLATFFCNKIVAKKLTLQHFSNVAKKRPMLQKKKTMDGGELLKKHLESASKSGF